MTPLVKNKVHNFITSDKRKTQESNLSKYPRKCKVFDSDFAFSQEKQFSIHFNLFLAHIANFDLSLSHYSSQESENIKVSHQDPIGKGYDGFPQDQVKLPGTWILELYDSTQATVHR